MPFEIRKIILKPAGKKKQNFLLELFFSIGVEFAITMGNNTLDTQGHGYL